VDVCPGHWWGCVLLAASRVVTYNVGFEPIRAGAQRPNKGMKQTKPAQAMELRSLSPVLDR